MDNLDFLSMVKDIESYIIDIRRKLHQIPELGLEEFETSKLLKQELHAMNVSYESTAGTGVIATVGFGDRTVALRADMDALRIKEQTDVEYISKNDGYMHACGHDGHMAALLGAAKILKDNEEKLDRKVKILFQPSEENCKGAKMVLEEGKLNDCDNIFGVHIFNYFNSGKVSVESGARMAVSANFRLDFTGKSGHAAYPHESVDATVAGAAFVMNVQTVVSRITDPLEPMVVTIGRFDSGTTHNIISGKAHLSGTARYYSKQAGEKAKKAILKIAESTADMYNCQVNIEFMKETHPPVFNDTELTVKLKAKIVDIMGQSKAECVKPLLLGEDFANYQKKIPGVFAFVGGYNEKKGCVYPNHHEKFNFDEDVLKDAALLYIIAGTSM